jgi:hypothetical protein
LDRQEARRETTLQRLYKDSVALRLKTELPLKAYTGSYINDVYGNMKVVIEDGELRMKFMHHPHMYALLQPVGGSRFYATFRPEFESGLSFCC